MDFVHVLFTSNTMVNAKNVVDGHRVDRPFSRHDLSRYQSNTICLHITREPPNLEDFDFVAWIEHGTIMRCMA